MAFNNNNTTHTGTGTGAGLGNTHDNDGRLGAGTKGKSSLLSPRQSSPTPLPTFLRIPHHTMVDSSLTPSAARALQPDFTKDQSQIHREKAEGKIDE